MKLLIHLFFILISIILISAETQENSQDSFQKLDLKQNIKQHSFITREKIEALKIIAKFEVLDYNSHPFKDMTEKEMIQKLGLLLESQSDLNKINKIFPYGNINISSDLPENFNYQEKWPDCVKEIRDQGNCGSCWAFAASEVLSERFCIASNNQINIVLSPQDLVSCDSNDRGCGGGFVKKSWDYIKKTGIVSEECLPYSAWTGVSGICPFGSEPSLNFCKKGKFRKFKVKSHGQLYSILDAKLTIFNEGPIESAFNVYEDFLAIKVEFIEGLLKIL